MHNLYAQARWEKLEERKLEGYQIPEGTERGSPLVGKKEGGTERKTGDLNYHLFYDLT